LKGTGVFGGGLVFKLIVTELFKRFSKGGVTSEASLLRLLVVVVGDDILDGGGYAVCCVDASKTAESPKSEASDVPNWKQGSWADAALGEDLLKGSEVLALVLGHLFELRALGGAPKGGELALVDAHGAVLARVVYSQHPCLFRPAQLVPAGGRHSVAAGGREPHRRPTQSRCSSSASHLSAAFFSAITLLLRSA